MGRITTRRRILRIRDETEQHRPDTLVAEEPLEIRLNGRALTVTMRTPGDDFDLAAGFLVNEGVVTRLDEIVTIRYCAGARLSNDAADANDTAAADSGENTYNVLDVQLADGVAVPDATLERNFYTTSSCGVCGKASLDAVRTVARWPVHDDPIRLTPAGIAALPDRLRAAQRVFERTGGLHAAGLFTVGSSSDSSGQGKVLCVREDVGRHNAVDKLAGWALRDGRLPLPGTVLLVSGRASFELAQKTVMMGSPVLAAVSAPSSLAVDLAAETGLTLVGFVRGSSMNVYAGAHRLDLPGSVAAEPGEPAEPAEPAESADGEHVVTAGAQLADDRSAGHLARDE